MKPIKFIQFVIISGLTISCQPATEITPTVEPTPMPGLNVVPNVDVDSLIRIHSQQDVDDKRIALLELIFGQPNLPNQMPEVNTYVADDSTIWFIKPYQNFDVTLLTVRFGYGLVSNLLLVKSERKNGSLILYYTGHGGLTKSDQKNTVKLAKAGYDVLIIYLPFKGINEPNTGNNPVATLETECCGTIRLGQHHQLRLLDLPMSYFFTPVTAGLNYADTQGYTNYIMIGFSGGGWATVVYAALDLRISTSFTVAGSAPLWMRIPGYEDGDFEIQYLEMYKIANYLELYVMGASGEGRYQNQVVNFFDPCCYGGGRAEYYVSAVQDRIAQLGEGKFSLFVDHRTVGHALGENTYNHILNILESGEIEYP